MSSKLLQLIIQLKDEASAGLEKIVGSLGGLGGVLKGALAGAAIAGATAIGGLGVASVGAAADFQNATATFASVAGSSLADAGFALDDVKNKALDLGQSTAFSAAEAQQAMIELAKGGVPVVDIMGEATQATLDLAAAGELGLATAAEIVAKQLGVWASTGVEATDVANLMSQAANASTVGVEELALGLANVGGVAKASGLSFEEVTQTMAMLAPGFSSAADAGTSLKTMLISMTPKSADAAGAMKQLGIIATDYVSIADDLGVSFDGSAASMAALQDAIHQTIVAQTGATAGTKKYSDAYNSFMQDFEINKFYDASGAFAGMENASRLLADGLSGLSDQEKTVALNTIFGTDAFRAAAMIAEQGAEGYLAMGEAMAAAGTAAEQAAIRNATFKFALDSLKGAVETFMIVIGSALLPILTSLVDSITPVVGSITTFVQQILAAPAPMQALIAAIDTVIPGFSSLVDFISANLLPILSGLAAMVLYVVVPALITWATTSATAAIAIITPLLPIIATVAAIGAAVALLVAAWQNNWFGIQDATAAVWGYLQPIFTQIITWFQTNIPVAIAALASFWTGTLVPAFNSAVAVMQNIITTITTMAAAIWAAVQQIASQTAAGWAVVVAAVQSAWATVTSVVQSAITTVQMVVNTGVSIVTTIVQAAWNTLVFIASAAWAAVVAVIEPALSSISSAVSAGMSTVSSVVSSVWNTVTSVTSSTWSAISGVISPVVSTITSVISSAWSMISGTTTTTWSTVSSITSSTWSTISGIISPVVSAITSVISSAWATISSATSTVWNGLRSIVATAMGAVTTAINTAIATVRTVVLSGWAVIVAASQNKFNEIPGIISGAWAKIKSIMATGVAGIVSALTGAASQAVGLGRDIIDGVVNGISGAAGKIKDKLTDIAKGALNAAKSALGISSPSKVMMQEVGAPIVDGIVQGISNTKPKAIGEMLDLGSKLVDLVSKGVDAFGKLKTMGDIPQSAIVAFATAIKNVIAEFSTAISEFDKRMLSLAAKFAEKGGGVIDFLAKGVDMLAALSKLGSVPEAAIRDFAQMLRLAVEYLAAAVSEQVRMGLPAAMEFSQYATKIVEFIGGAVGNIAKLKDFQSVPWSTYQSFGNNIVAAVAVIKEAMYKFAGESVKWTGNFAENAGRVIAIIGPAVDNIAKLKDFQGVPWATYQSFSNNIVAAVVLIRDAMYKFSGETVKWTGNFAENASRIITMIGPAIDNISKLRTFEAVPAAIFTSFSSNLTLAIQTLLGVTAKFKLDSVTAGAAIAEGFSKLIALIGPAVDGLTKLKTFEAVSAATFTTFGNNLTTALQLLLGVAAKFKLDATTAGAAVAEGLSKLVALIGPAVDGLTKLKTFEAVPAAIFTAFGNSLTLAIQTLLGVAAKFKLDATTAGAAVAEGLSKLIALVGPAVDGLTKLRIFEAVPAAVFVPFANALQQALQHLLRVAATFNINAVTAGAAVAEGASKLVSLLGTGVDGLTKLKSFEAVPAAVFGVFAEALRQALTALMNAIRTFNADAVAAAAELASGAGVIVGIIAKGVEGLNALSGLGPVSEAAIAAFVAAILVTMQRLAAGSTQFQVEALQHAKTFADAAGAAVGILADGVEGMLLVDTFVGVSEEAIARFAAGVTLAVAAMARLAAEFGPEATAAANVFAKAAGESTDFLKKGVEGFTALAALAEVPAESLAVFSEAIVALINSIAELSTIVSGDILAQATRFALGIDQVITVVVAALRALGTLAEQAGMAPLFVTTVIDTVNALAADLAPAVVPPAQNIGQAIAQGIAAGVSSGTPAIVSAVNAAVAAALAAARSALGISSPSKVFEQAIGMPAGQGLVAGLDASTMAVEAAASRLASATVVPAQQAAAPVAITSRTQAPVAGPSGPAVVIEQGAIVINAQPGQNVEALAEAVIRRIEQRTGMKLAR